MRSQHLNDISLTTAQTSNLLIMFHLLHNPLAFVASLCSHLTHKDSSLKRQHQTNTQVHIPTRLNHLRRQTLLQLVQQVLIAVGNLLTTNLRQTVVLPVKFCI